MFIIGGLIAVAVVALLLAFFLARGDSSASSKPELAEKQAQAELTAAPAAGAAGATTPAVEMPRTAESQPELISANNNSRAAYDGKNEETILRRSGVSLPTHYYDEDTSVQSLNRQVYELAGQLRSLQRQSQEIERSLIELSGVIESMDERGRHSTSFSSTGVYSPKDALED